MRKIVSLVVIGVDTHAFATECLFRAQKLSRVGIFDRLADLLAHEIRDDCIGLKVRAQVTIGGLNAHAAFRPSCKKRLAPLFRCRLEDRLWCRVQAICTARADHFAIAAAKVCIIGLYARDLRFGQRGIAGRYGIGCGALENGQVRSFLRDHRDHLNTRRSGAYDAYALPTEFDPFVRPVSGVQDVSRKTFKALDLRFERSRQASDGKQKITCRI